MTYNQKILTEISEINRLMRYDRSKSILEQESIYTNQMFNPRYGTFSKPETAKKYLDDVEDLVDNIKWDHEVSAYFELGLTGVGLLLTATGIGAPIGLAMLGTATVIGVTDAVVYIAEGDPYMGAMMLALSVIPGGELINLVGKRGGKELTKEALEEVPGIINKIKKYGVKSLTDAEGATWELFEYGFKKNAPEIAVKSAAKVTKATIATLKTLKLYGLLKLAAKLGITVFKVGRIAITFDMLWTLAAAPDSWRARMKNKSEFKIVMDKLYDGTLDDAVMEMLYNWWYGIDPTLEDQFKDGIIAEIDMENSETVETINNEMANETSQMQSPEVPEQNRKKWDSLGEPVEGSTLAKTESGDVIQREPVRFRDLLSGKYVIQPGAKGDVVRDIQRMLVRLGYDLGDTGKTKDGVDGDYTKNGKTWDAIIDFQLSELNNVDDLIDGVVGQRTATKLKELYDEKRK